MKTFLKLFAPVACFLYMIGLGAYDYFAEQILTENGQEVAVTFIDKQHNERRWRWPETCYTSYVFRAGDRQYTKHNELSKLEYCDESLLATAVYWPAYPHLVHLADWKLNGVLIFWLSILSFHWVVTAFYQHITGKTLSFKLKKENLRARHYLKFFIVFPISLCAVIFFGYMTFVRTNILLFADHTMATIRRVELENGLLFGKDCVLSYSFMNKGIKRFRDNEVTEIEACDVIEGQTVEVLIRPNDPDKAYLVITAQTRFKYMLLGLFIALVIAWASIYEGITGKRLNLLRKTNRLPSVHKGDASAKIQRNKTPARSRKWDRW